MSRHRRRTTRRRRAAAAAGAGVAALGVAAPSAQATSSQVKTLADSGADSLRDAIAKAEADAAPDVITFAPGLTGTITLASKLTVTKPVTITGPGASVLKLDGPTTAPTLEATAGSLTVSGLTITDGTPGVRALGPADLTLTDAVVTGNVPPTRSPPGAINGAYGGGGVYTGYGNVLLDRVTVVGNRTFANDGAGVRMYNSKAVIRRSTIADNEITSVGMYSPPSGAGLSYYGRDLLVEGSTISGNRSSGDGGGVDVLMRNTPTRFVIRDTTISGNTAAADGGGLRTDAYESMPMVPLVLSADTIAGNTASNGGGVLTTEPTVKLDSTVVAGNRSTDPDVDLQVAAGGTGTFSSTFSLVQRPGAVALGAGALTGLDPKLGPPADNGGPTRTLAPFAGSPLLDAGHAIADTGTTDQRGAARTVDLDGVANAADGTDIGAVEAAATPPAPVPVTTVVAPPPPPDVVAPAVNGRFLFGLAGGKASGAGTIQLTLPGAGKLAAAGGGIAPVSRTVAQAGPLTLSVKLGKAALKTLKKKRKLTAKVKVTFTPTGGTAVSATKAVAFTTRKAKR